MTQKDNGVADVRQWWHYPIEMPVTAEGRGPATVGGDAARITYEVWDVLLNTHASYDNLPDAINEAMRLNALLADRRHHDQHHPIPNQTAAPRSVGKGATKPYNATYARR